MRRRVSFVYTKRWSQSCWLAVASACASSSEAQGSSPKSARAVVEAERLGEAFARVAALVSASVVSIRVEAKSTAPPFPFHFFGAPPGQERGGIERGNGSGVVVRSNGYILTNNHVVDGATRIEVMLRNKRRYSAEVIGRDPATDLAVLKIKASGLAALEFADARKVRVGQLVLAVGSPFGLDYTVTSGVVSATGRGGIGANEIEDYLQTDASINPGNSGGPLVNLRGKVVGINSMIVGRATGIGFAVPANLAKSVATQLIAHGKVRRPWIGVGFQELTPELAEQFGLKEQRGALVGAVVPGGPADKAGMEAGDIVVAVDGEAIQESADLLRYILAKEVGQRVKLKAIRQGKTRSLLVRTEERPKSQGQSRASGARAPSSREGDSIKSAFGFSVRAVPTGKGKGTQVRVAEVVPGSSADRAGLRRGDTILQVDRQSVKSTEQVADALKDGRALLRVQREGSAFFTVVSK